MKVWKKVLSSVLALSMVLSSFTVAVSAEEMTQKINYALGAEASANDVEVDYWGADKTVDGIVNREDAKADQSRWSTNPGDDAKVLDVNLGAERTFDEFKIEWERTNIKGFTIEVSSDGETYETAYAKTDDSYVQLTTIVKLDEAVSGQYVRLSVDNYDGGDINWASVSIYEFEVLGTVSVENLALGATATASDIEDPAFAASKANDGIANTDEEENLLQSRWASDAEVEEKWLQLDFGAAKTVASVVLVWERCNAIDYKIQYSNDGSEWADAAAFTAKPVQFTQVINFEEAVEAQYIRLLINDFDPQGPNAAGTDVNWPTVSVYEFEAYSVEIAEEGSNETVDSVIAALEVPTVDVEAGVWTLPEVPAAFDIEFIGADYEQIIDRDLTIYQPLVDTTVSVNYRVTKEDVTKETSAYEVVVPGKYSVEEGDNAKPVVIPEMAEWKGHTGEFATTADTALVINPEYKDELAFVAESFAADYEVVTGKAIEIEYSTAPEAGDFYFTLGSEDAGLKEEGYIMTVADYVTVEAVETTGAFWAVQSIMQIIEQTEGTIAKGIARDYPKFEVRGFMLDVARKSFDLDYLYDTLKQMAYYKMNDFQIHLNDNYIFLEEYTSAGEDPMTAYSGFRLESDIKEGGNNGLNKADLTSKDVFYTKDEFRTLIEYAREMGIDIVPEFDTPAHSLAFTKVRPDLKLGNNGRQNDHFNITTAESLAASEEFIFGVWDEYLDGENPVFDMDTIINVGTDEYSGYNEQFRQMTDDLLAYAQSKGRTVRLWGSLSEKSGSTQVRSEGVQMNIWNTGWASPAAMYKQGFDLINMVDGTLYIVPAAGYYYDYLNAKSLYNNWNPNTMGGTTIPAGSDQMLGSAYAIWNDMIDKRANGISEYDIFDRFDAALPAMSSKLWGDGEDLTYDEVEKVAATLGTAPNCNAYGEVASKSEVIVEYDFDDLKDASGNRYDAAEGENTAFEDGALQLNGGASYINTALDKIGPNAEISVMVKAAADGEGEQILFEDGHTTVKMAQAGTGKVGFSREGYDYSFNYELPKEEWVKLTFKTYQNTTELYVNDELVDTLGKGLTGDKYATLVFPLATIGSETDAFKGLVDDFVVTTVVVVDDSATRIPTNDFTVTTDNEYNGSSTTEGPIAFAFDGDESTIWHSNYSPYQALPATVEIDMGKAYVIDQFDYLPRQDGSENGRITKYELYGKLAETDEYTLISEGNWISSTDIKKVYFDAFECQYLKLVAVEGDTNSGNMFASAAEFYVHEYDAKADLKGLYSSADTFTEEDAALFTEESWNALMEAKAAALAVIEKEDATAEEIAEALAALQSALDGLTEVGGEPTPTPKPDYTNPFKDVTRTKYYYNPVLWGVGNGVVAGLTNDTFGPNVTCSRAQIVTFIWRAMGKPEASDTTCTFTDVKASSFYYKAMLWGVENGIVNGWNETTFAPDATCTRAEIVTFIWRALGKPEASNTEHPFTDVKAGKYYYNAMLWSVENGIAKGYAADKFAPAATVTRGETVTFLYRAFAEDEGIVGTWRQVYTYDDIFLERLGEDVDEYMDYDSVSLTYTYKYFYDNTYTFTSTVDQFIDSLETMLINGMDAYFEALIIENGEQGEITVDEVWAQMGMSRDNVFEAFGLSKLEETITAYAEGQYVAEDGKLYASGNIDTEVSKEAYETFEVTDSTLTLTGYYEEGELVDAESYPIVFNKVK